MATVVPATRFEAAAVANVRYPPLPRTVVETAQLLASTGGAPDTKRLAAIVNLDPVVAAAVLRRVNSAHFGLREHVGDIGVAVFLLGFQEVCNIVLTEGMLKLRNIIRSEEQVRLFEQIMRTSIAAASFADKIATHLVLRNASTAFTAGLLHASGRLVLLYNRPDDYEALWLTASPVEGPTKETEDLIFGTNHIELGHRAAQYWNLPDELKLLLERSDNPEALAGYPVYPLGLSLSIAVRAAVSVGYPSNIPIPFEAPPAIETLASLFHRSSDELVGVVEECIPEVMLLLDEVMRGNNDSLE